MSDTCECPVAGFCSRYNRVMGARAFAICRGDVLTPEKCEVYRANWARLADPSCPIKRPPPPKPPPEVPAEITKLAGDRLADLLSALGIPPCNSCAKRKLWLNRAHAWLLGKPDPNPESNPKPEPEQP